MTIRRDAGIPILMAFGEGTHFDRLPLYNKVSRHFAQTIITETETSILMARETTVQVIVGSKSSRAQATKLQSFRLLATRLQPSMLEATKVQAKNLCHDAKTITSSLEFTYLEEMGSNTNPNDVRKNVVKLCQDAIKWNPAGICVRSKWVPLVSNMLSNCPAKVTTVVGFPDKKGGAIGTATTKDKVKETLEAVKNGADEIDMVINIPALLNGDFPKVKDDIASVVKAAQGKVVKVILETGLLTEKQIKISCCLAEEAGARFVKTSTGYGPRGASLKDAELMISACKLGIKLSGGIRSLEQCRQVTQLITDGRTVRFGTSSGSEIAQKEYDEIKQEFNGATKENKADINFKSPKNWSKKEIDAFKKAMFYKHELIDKIKKSQEKGIPVVYLSIPVRPNEVMSKEQNKKLREELISDCKATGVAYVDPFEADQTQDWVTDPGLEPKFKEQLFMDTMVGIWPKVIRHCNAIIYGSSWKYSNGARGEHTLATLYKVPLWDGKSQVSNKVKK